MCLGLLALPVLASGWTLDAPLQGPAVAVSELQVRSVSWDRDGGYLLDVSLSDGSNEVLRLDAQDRLLSRRLATVAGDAVYSRAKVGSLRQDGNRYAGCVVKLAPDGNVLWSSLDSARYANCTSSVTTPSGATWLIDNFAVGRVDPVGRYVLSRQDTVALNLSVQALAPTGDEGIYTAGGVFLGAVAARLAADGSLLWRTELGLAQPNFNCKIITAQERDFGIRVSCRPWDSGLTEFWDLSTDGVILAHTQLPHSYAGHGYHQLSAIEQHPEVSISGFSPQELIRFDSERNVLWRYDLSDNGNQIFRQLQALVVDENGELRVITERFDESSQRHYYDFIAFNLDGTVRLHRPIPDDTGFTKFFALPDGQFLTAYALDHRVDRDGNLTTVPLGWQDQMLIAVVPVKAFSGPSDRLVVAARGSQRALQSYAVDGSLRWEQALPEHGTRSGVDVGSLAVNASVICWRSTSLVSVYPVDCFERESGAFLRSFELAEGTDVDQRWLLLNDKTVALIDGSQLRFLSLLDGADVRPPEPIASAQQRIIGQHGTDRFALTGGPRDWAYWLDTEETEKLELADSNSQQLVLPNGVFSLVSTQIPLRWQARGQFEVIEFAADLVIERLLLSQDGDHYVFLAYNDASSWLTAVDTRTGSVLWRQDLPWKVDGLGAVGAGLLMGGELSEPGRGFVALATLTDLQLIAFNLSSGELLATRSEPCASISCRYWTVGESGGSNGINLLLERTYEPTAQRVVSLHMAANEIFPQLIRPDQSGVAGAWYNPDHRGQGFVLSYVAESKTLFMPWFVYDRNDRLNDESTLRWYSLQGQVSADSATVQLQILRNQGGGFAQGPATEPEVVGTAQLRFESCDRSNLQFRFNSGIESGHYGIIPLQRLGLRTRECDLGGPGIEPPQVAPNGSQGMHANQSGAWFDPASSGQGVMVEVVPPDASQEGLIFATWFSYDLAGESDDPGAQDWFVMQGDLRNAEDGTTTVLIYRSLGGRLDLRATPHLFRVGEADFQFNSCDGLRMRYRFDDNEQARRHRGLHGTHDLVRIGGCVQ